MPLFNLFIFIAAVFFVVCGLHRLMNRRNVTNELSSLNISSEKFLAILGGYMCCSIFFPSIVHQILLTHHSFQRNPVVLVNFIMQMIIFLFAIAIFAKKKLLYVFCKRASFSEIVFSAIYNFGVAIPIVTFFATIWFYLLNFLKSNGLPIELKSQYIVNILLNLKDSNDLILFSITACIFVPVTEEIIFRGLIYRFLKRSVKPLIANIVTAFIFAYLHNNIFAFASLFVLSLTLVNLYEQNRDLRAPILMHSFFNLFNIIVCLGGGMQNGTFSQ